MVDNSLADDALDYDDTPREDEVADAARPVGETEPATRHDVAEGGVLGAVGGAVVGMLAGGPVGAVIGAVVGGAASAGAVDVVDKHDHDYERTASSGDTAAPVADASTAQMTDASTAPVVVSAAPVVAPAAAPGPAAEASVPAVVAETGLVPVETAPVETAETTDVTARIRVRAYELYDQRGRRDGRDVTDWLEAEREVGKG